MVMQLPNRPLATLHAQLTQLGRSGLEAVERIGLPMVIGMGIASAQVTLLFRGNHVPDGIAASLVWMAGAVLLSEIQEQRSAGKDKRWKRWLGLLSLGWCLLVLTFSARFYDPLILLMPLACFIGISLLEGSSPRSRTLRDLILIGGLLPLQHELAGSLPTGMIVALTARFSCVGLWGIGRDCYAEGSVMSLTEYTLRVDAPCAGVDTLALAFTSSLMFLVLFPVRRRWFTLLGLIGGSVLIAFLLNVVRVIVLALSSKACDKHWWSQWCGFEFWHVGAGSHLFAFLAVSGACALWWWNINSHEANTSVGIER